jgi:hypothetical protein
MPIGHEPEGIEMRNLLQAVTLLASFSSLGVSVGALYYARSSNATASALAKYDLTTPKQAMTSFLKMALNADMQAMAEYRFLAEKAEIAEQLNTLEVHKEREHKGQVLLFVRYKRQGIPKQSVERFEKDARTGLWVYKDRVYTFTSPDDGDVGKEISAWESMK